MSKPFITRQEALARVGELEKELARLKASDAPGAAIARGAENAARSAAADLSASRRAPASATAPKPASTLTAAEYQAARALPAMTRAEFAKLPAGEKGLAIRQVRIVD